MTVRTLDTEEKLSSALVDLLAESAALHNHLCPRQVLGVRMGLLAGELLSIEVPQPNKRLYTFVETDGCFADGVSVAVNCWLGRRTMRLIDYGRVAATFVDTRTGRAVRIAPNPQARQTANYFAPDERSRWHTMLEAYQIMPADELFTWQPVDLKLSIQEIISIPGHRTVCEACGEEILNQREIVLDGHVLCKACHEGAYYTEQG